MADVVERYTLTKGGDTMTVEILDDGTIKSQTSKVSQQNHQNAEGFFSYLGKLLGGKATRDRRGTHGHAHQVHENEQHN